MNLQGIADYFGIVVTSLYGKFQGDAGRKVGVDPGAAWRAALKDQLHGSKTSKSVCNLPSIRLDV